MKLEGFGAVEVHRCFRCVDAGLNGYVEIADGDRMAEEAEGGPFWAVYLRPAPPGGDELVCVADCASEEHAGLVAQALRAALDAPVTPGAEVDSLLAAFEGVAASCRDRGAVPVEVANALVARSRALRRGNKQMDLDGEHVGSPSF